MCMYRMITEKRLRPPSKADLTDLLKKTSSATDMKRLVTDRKGSMAQLCLQY